MVLIWGVIHCTCKRTQTQQAQYNEFGREAGSRTGPLRGFRQRSGRIVREQDHQRGKGGVKVCPRASSEDEFFFSSSDTTRLELLGVFRIAIPLFWVASVVYLFISFAHPSPTFVSHPGLSSSACPFSHSFWHSVSSCPGVTSTSTGSEC